MHWSLRLGLGALAGALAGWIVWSYAKKQLDAEFQKGAGQLSEELGEGRRALEQRLAAGRRQLQREVQHRVDTAVPPVVRRTIDQTLSRYGITRTTGQRINRVLALAERVGVI